MCIKCNIKIKLALSFFVGGYKKSGFGRETHKMMLNHYRQTKNMLISFDKNKLGFF